MFTLRSAEAEVDRHPNHTAVMGGRLYCVASSAGLTLIMPLEPASSDETMMYRAFLVSLDEVLQSEMQGVHLLGRAIEGFCQQWQLPEASWPLQPVSLQPFAHLYEKPLDMHEFFEIVLLRPTHDPLHTTLSFHCRTSGMDADGRRQTQFTIGMNRQEMLVGKGDLAVGFVAYFGSMLRTLGHSLQHWTK